MKIALTTVGSTGDTQPYIALALKLMDAGHQVRVCSHPFHEARFASRGIDYAPCGPVVTQDRLNKMLDKMISTKNPVKQIRMLMEEAFFEEGDRYLAECKAATHGFDLAISHMADFLGQEAVSQNNIPRIGVILAPAAIPTRYNSVHLGPKIKWLYPLQWRLMTAMLAGTDRRAMNYMRSLGGTKQNIKRFSALSPDLNLIAASPLICPTFPDLPAEFAVTGHWALPEPEFDPPSDLQDFLEKYPRPVVISLGSMGGTQGEKLTRKLLDAVKLSGFPAVIQSGYAGLFAQDAPENVFFADYVPHDWLFSRGMCVVHHGGAGTTHAAVRSGVPSIVIAFIADQPYFASNLKRLGIAPKMLWHFRLSPKRLSKRIRQVASDQQMQNRAKEIGKQLRSENGLDKALQIIEAHAAKIINQEATTP
jgi:sterol 3beta-glucosyltransferase